jgi:AraC-like DNA-binding protein
LGNPPPAVGGTVMEHLRLESGFALNITDMRAKECLKIECSNLEGCVGFGYCHAGVMLFERVPSSWPAGIKQGQMAVFSTPDFASYVESFPPIRQTTRVSISAPKSLVGDLNEQYDGLLEQAGLTADGESFLQAYAPGAEVRRILADILECRYSGPLRRVFLEAKALELLAGSLREIDSGLAAGRPNPPLDRRQVEQAERAACLLGESFEDVPSLGEVARQVGLSRCRLGEVFQKVHGATPFAWLRAKRLETARTMLADGTANVTEAALAVGYSSLSHFTKAFTSRFDIHPSECRKKSRGFSAPGPA